MISNSQSKPRILKYGPLQVTAGEEFLRQESADNAMWFELESSSGSYEVLIDGISLPSTIDRSQNAITVRVPPWLTQFEAELTCVIRNLFSKEDSDPVFLKVTSSSNNPLLNFDNLKKEYLTSQEKLYSYTSKPKPRFSGWGMSTMHCTPWELPGKESEIFLNACQQMEINFEVTESTGVTTEYLKELYWRHWNVLKITRIAIQSTFLECNQIPSFVECGAGDGKTAFFTLHALSSSVKYNDHKVFLFDAWEGMKPEDMGKDQVHLYSRYANSSIERTKRNLKNFEKSIDYIKGYLPDTLPRSNIDKNTVIYLHIDLNQANATKACLEYFMPEMPKGSIVLFDDYGWHDYHDTRVVADEVMGSYKGEFMLLPTGQAYFQKD
ncbi:MAG TPA: TylF/MycF/NovP-related O-methyltransferase [Oligoflexia bacterium]|nr:TylF/MycF/NovP-related O-methyltransferase [Oligoflexia bacterium]HMP49665.1 TylF/MycF/NovP-related O-methyltransferase [Oligoflexia bacterium]